MSLVSVEEVRALVPSGMTDAQIQAVIDREEAAVIEAFGPHCDGSEIVETAAGRGRDLFLRRPLAAVSSVEEWNGSAWEAVDASLYWVWGGQGRIERTDGASWAGRCRVTYTPVDDTLKRKSVVLELVRLALEREAMKSASVGEYSFTAPDWEAERARVLSRLKLGL